MSTVATTDFSPSFSIQDFLQQEREKDLLRFSTAGSVDDGKSTLIGRLLYDTQSVYEDQVRSIEGKGTTAPGQIDFALLTDGLRAEREQGRLFMPKFDSAGLLTAVVQHADSGEVLMVAFMDREALDRTRETGLAHFHSRSRGRLWKKGETSGHVLHVQQVLVDCDQDALVLKALPEGPACHTGARSCFYRALEGDRLRRID